MAFDNALTLMFQPRPDDLTVWQIALLRSIWRRPSLWLDGHRDVEALSRRGLVRTYERYLFLTDAGITMLRATGLNDESGSGIEADPA